MYIGNKAWKLEGEKCFHLIVRPLGKTITVK